MTSIYASPDTVQASRTPHSENQPRAIDHDGRIWRRMAATAALTGVMLLTLTAGWFTPSTQNMGVSATATSAQYTGATSPRIVCGALSLPC